MSPSLFDVPLDVRKGFCAHSGMPKRQSTEDRLCHPQVYSPPKQLKTKQNAPLT